MPESLKGSIEGLSLAEAIRRAASVFAKDLELVAEAARAHNVALSKGDVFYLPRPGAYNLRLPKGDMGAVQRLAHSGRVIIACMDYRQSSDVVDATKANVWMLMAGGAAQPNERRLAAAVDLVAALYRANPEMQFSLLAHNRICGGVNHFTGGRIVGLSHEGEMGELELHLNNTDGRLQDLGVPRGAYELGIARIGEGNDFLGISWV